MQSKVSYIDFTQKFQGIETSIRIFENKTHIFVYVNQCHNDISLYNEKLKKVLSNSCLRAKRKKLEIICNLKNYECVEEIGKEISKIVDHNYQ